MRSPSIVPGFDVDVYLVLDDFGSIGRAYREVDESEADKASVIRRLIEGQYNNPVRVVAFNTSEGWSRDVSEDENDSRPSRASPGALHLATAHALRGGGRSSIDRLMSDEF